MRDIVLLTFPPHVHPKPRYSVGNKQNLWTDPHPVWPWVWHKQAR
jgi:hypothetical protein